MTTENEQASNGGELDGLFAAARREAAALTLAQQVGDTMNAVLAATRLRRLLAQGSTTLDAVAVRGSARHAQLATIFSASTQGMQELLGGAPTAIADRDQPRLTRWVLAMRSTQAPHLFDFDAAGRSLQDADLAGLRVTRSRFITDMRRASFLDAHLETSDFTYADLGSTLWQRTCVERSYFRDCSFVDAAFDDARFIDCDLQRADFGMDSLELTSGIAFVRCDLRAASWRARDLSRIQIVDCWISDADDWAGPGRRVSGRGNTCLPGGPLLAARAS